MKFKKLRGLFSGKSEKEANEDARKRQNLWLTAQQTEWQLAWHELFDKDPGQATADNAARSDDVPEDLNSDYRLICGFCEVTVETRAACFALLPHGQELAKRFEQFYTSRNSTISSDQALELVGRLRSHIKDCTVNFQGNWEHIVIVEDDDKATLDALAAEYSVYEIFEESLLKPHLEDKLTEIAADLFLTEPFYAAAGNCYEPEQWITGIYRESAQDRCLGIVYELWLGGWKLSVGSEGIALIAEPNS